MGDAAVTEWVRSRWLHIMTPDGVMAMETSSPGEIRTLHVEHPDWSPERLWQRGGGDGIEYDWRSVTPEQLDADCKAEDEWYDRAIGLQDRGRSLLLGRLREMGYRDPDRHNNRELVQIVEKIDGPKAVRDIRLMLEGRQP